VVVAAAQQSPGEFEFFEKKIRPVLVERCYKCHSASAEKLKGDLLLDSKVSWVQIRADPQDKQYQGFPEESIAEWHQRLGFA